MINYKSVFKKEGSIIYHISILKSVRLSLTQWWLYSLTYCFLFQADVVRLWPNYKIYETRHRHKGMFGVYVSINESPQKIGTGFLGKRAK